MAHCRQGPSRERVLSGASPAAGRSTPRGGADHCLCRNHDAFHWRASVRIVGQARGGLVAADAAFGMSRMTELLSQLKSPEMIIRTFRDYDTAVQWLMNMGSSP